MISPEDLDEEFTADGYRVYGTQHGGSWHVLVRSPAIGPDQELLVTGDEFADAMSSVMEKGPPVVRAVSHGMPIDPLTRSVIEQAILAWDTGE